jgi:hypothetical protein
VNNGNCPTIWQTPDTEASCTPPPVAAPTADTGSLCQPEWSCTDWGECVEGTQTRSCTVTNNCELDTGKPAESQTCESAAQTPLATGYSILNLGTGGSVIATILLLLLLLLPGGYFLYRRARPIRRATRHA